ncbi:hypothetical protein [Pseudosulfitobacter pseudonitzschiae]|nr:hypothetical protein [Pseudosulfitobacter pseudonitzschiae]MBM1817466.1 hypothetical protein [Pseudosulfitobacter pseudonitzschiae]MBM1834443.1 hypothetical protein [Pseudosulfitobacter pseudonitzschiae]MBM1839242.1 hypothetical protein [Pseudosulfitobacter pseudonitzschiae]MBM1844158.1 hypothetical protein [Pseudosulfitobacter pseudonitzschiae]MBM1848927.1 hypothetical protein [Pseudosulfitobacter pseudonitzschiae]
MTDLACYAVVGIKCRAFGDRRRFCLSTLRHKGHARISSSMKRLFNIDDRARLRERFFGATHAVLARL